MQQLVFEPCQSWSIFWGVLESVVGNSESHPMSAVIIPYLAFDAKTLHRHQVSFNTAGGKSGLSRVARTIQSRIMVTSTLQV